MYTLCTLTADTTATASVVWYLHTHKNANLKSNKKNIKTQYDMTEQEEFMCCDFI